MVENSYMMNEKIWIKSHTMESRITVENNGMVDKMHMDIGSNNRLIYGG
jgi:hypothetical protein